MTMSDSREVVERLIALESRIAQLESKLDALADVEKLRAELRAKDEQIDALGRQGLHTIDLLDTARRKIEQLEAGDTA